MKTSLLVLALSFTGALAQGSNLQTLKAVVNSPAATEAAAQMAEQGFENLEEAKLIATYRCPGCFDYALVFRGEAGQKQAILRTSGMSGELSVTLREIR